MTVGRRSFLKVFGMAPIAAKVATDGAMAELTKTVVSGTGTSLPMPQFGASPEAAVPSPSQIKTALNVLGLREEVEGMLYQQQRSVYALDPDIAVHRSFSLNAKIAFQRHRNVARQIEDMTEGYWWNRMMDRLRGSR